MDLIKKEENHYYSCCYSYLFLWNSIRAEPARPVTHFHKLPFFIMCLLNLPADSSIQENPQAFFSLMEDANSLFRLVKNGAAAEENNPFFFISPKIKFWCHAWLLQGKYFYLSGGKMSIGNKTVGLIKNVMFCLSCVFCSFS